MPQPRLETSIGVTTKTEENKMYLHPEMLTALANERRHDLIAENERRHVLTAARRARRHRRAR